MKNLSLNSIWCSHKGTITFDVDLNIIETLNIYPYINGMPKVQQIAYAVHNNLSKGFSKTTLICREIKLTPRKY